MPDLSNIDTLVNAINSRQTTITKALKQLWDDRNTVADAGALVASLGTLALVPLGSPVAAALMARGLTSAEITHLDKWPMAEKNKVRTALQAALASGSVPNVFFFWELYSGATSQTLVASPPASQDVHIIFQSPQTNVRKGGITWGQIFVDPKP
jgi:hypothetical protein